MHGTVAESAVKCNRQILHIYSYEDLSCRRETARRTVPYVLERLTYKRPQ